MDLPYDLQAAIEVYVAEAMRATGTARGSVSAPVEHEPSPVESMSDMSAYVIDDAANVGLNYGALFEDEPPSALPRTRAARGTRPPTGAEPVWVSFEDDVTEPMQRPPTSER